MNFANRRKSTARTLRYEDIREESKDIMNQPCTKNCGCSKCYKEEAVEEASIDSLLLNHYTMAFKYGV